MRWKNGNSGRDIGKEILERAGRAWPGEFQGFSMDFPWICHPWKRPRIPGTSLPTDWDRGDPGIPGRERDNSRNPGNAGNSGKADPNPPSPIPAADPSGSREFPRKSRIGVRRGRTQNPPEWGEEPSQNNPGKSAGSGLWKRSCGSRAPRQEFSSRKNPKKLRNFLACPSDSLALFRAFPAFPEGRGGIPTGTGRGGEKSRDLGGKIQGIVSGKGARAPGKGNWGSGRGFLGWNSIGKGEIP